MKTPKKYTNGLINRLIAAIALLVFFSCFAYTQVPNYALNGSFEDVYTCPFKEGQIELEPHYYSSLAKTIDLFSTCGINGLGLPDNSLGSQLPAHGNLIAGIIATTKGYGFYDHITGTLDTVNMKDSQEYCLSVKVSLAENSPYIANQFAFFFSPHKNFYYYSSSNYPYYPHSYYDPRTGYETTNIPLLGDINLSDTKNWMLLKNKTTFYKGIESYFWIGNNRFAPAVTRKNNTTQRVFNPDRTAYYYIDDIIISEVNNDTIEVNPKLKMDCFEPKMVVDLPDDPDTIICYYDDTKLDVFSGNRGVFDLNTDFSRITVQGIFRHKCDVNNYKITSSGFSNIQSELFSLYPNPATGKLYYTLLADSSIQDFRTSVYDSKGKLIKIIVKQVNYGINTIEYDISDLETAIYYFKVELEYCNETIKVMINN